MDYQEEYDKAMEKQYEALRLLLNYNRMIHISVDRHLQDKTICIVVSPDLAEEFKKLEK